MMLMGKNATVTVCHTKTVNTAEICRKADILVSAAGVLNSLTKDYVRPGQVVIDVSINWDENKPNARGGLGAIAGDAVYAEVEPIVEAITPVPGGAQVKEMWLTHYSPSLTRPEEYMDEVRRIFPEAKAGKDRMSRELAFE